MTLALIYRCSRCDHADFIACPEGIEPPALLLCPACRDAAMHHAGVIQTEKTDGTFQHGTPEDAIGKLERRLQAALLAMPPDSKHFPEAEATQQVMAYYDDQIAQVRAGTHPSFPPGYVVVKRA